MIKLNPTAYKSISKDNPKDLVEVVYGDDKDLTKFQPQQKIQRWDNECNVSIRLIEDKDELKETAMIIEENGKIKHIKSKRECHFYNLPVSEEHSEGASEFEIILKSDPRKKKGEDYTIEFSLVDKDVNYFYQPALTPEEIAEGCLRPENIVGSYAIYAKINKTNYISKEQSDLRKIIDKLVEIGVVSVEMSFADQIKTIPADKFTSPDIEKLFREAEILQAKIDKDTRVFKEYKCGKIGHIPFPYMMDANGWKVRAKDLNINQVEKRLRVVVPADFLDNAVYPVMHAAGLTFGRETSGATASAMAGDRLQGSDFTSPAGTNTITDLTYYVGGDGAERNTKGVVVVRGTLNILSGGVGGIIAAPTTAGWRTSHYTTPAVIAASTLYSLTMVSAGQINFYYDETGGAHINDSTNSYTTPVNPTDAGTGTRYFSIYATYTAGGGGNPVQPNHLLSLMGCGN